MPTLRIVLATLFAGVVLASSDDSAASDSAQTPAYSSAYKAGRAAAERDIKKGVLAVEDWGLPGDFEVERIYRRILSERYGITLRRVAGCEVDDKILGHGNGYNDVSVAEIERRFGHKLLDRVYAQAEKQARATR